MMDVVDPSDMLTMSLDDILAKKREAKNKQGGRGKTERKPRPAKTSRAPLQVAPKVRLQPRVRQGRKPRAQDFFHKDGGAETAGKWKHDLADLGTDDEMIGGGGPVRGRGAANRQNRKEANAPYARPRAPILSRLGAIAAGVTITVSNLNEDVEEDDVESLFATIGKVTSCHLKKDKNGHSLGTATVIMPSKVKALESVAQFNKRTLDGTPMKVVIADTGAGSGGGETTEKSRPRPVRSNVPSANFAAMALEREGALGRTGGLASRRTGGAGRARAGSGGGAAVKGRGKPRAESLDEQMDNYYNKK